MPPRRLIHHGVSGGFFQHIGLVHDRGKHPLRAKAIHNYPYYSGSVKKYQGSIIFVQLS
jgi:hypothetical protein